jgi:type IV secretion/conjugal transfer VirB4 family ATPase
MTCVEDITKEYREAGALNGLIALHSALDEKTFLTKAGHLVQALRVHGVDHECLDHSQLNQVARRFEAALRTLPGTFRLYQLMLKRDHAPLPSEEPASPTVREAVRNRIEFLQTKSEDLYTLDLYFVIIYECGLGNQGAEEKWRRAVRQPREALAQWLSHEATLRILESDLTRAVEALATRVRSFAHQLGDVLPLEILDTKAGFQLFARLVNYAPFKSDVLTLRSPEEVDYQLANSALECYRDHLQLDDYQIRVLTLKDLPAQTFPNMLRSLQELPCNLIAVTEWKREDNFDMRRAINSQRRHHHNSKASLANYAPWNDQPASSNEMLIDDSEVAHVADLGQSLRDMEVAGRYFGQFSFTAILYGLDPVRLERSVAECFKIFSTHDAVLYDERYNLLNAWLAAIPGNDAYNLRRLWLMDTNYADLSFLFAHHTGDTWNRHLDREYLALLETNHASPYFLNLHCADIAHSLILGATGSGKSFLVNFLLTHLQKYDPFTCIFDLGGSYEATTQLFDGAYVRVGIENRAFTINPFCLPPTDDNLNFLFSFVKVLIESNGYRMDNATERDLFEAIGNLYEAPEEVRRLRSLLGMIRKPLAEQLSKWTANGQFGTLFDNVEDNLTFAKFQAFDFEGMDKYPQVLEPLLFYVLHRANAAIQNAAEATLSKWFVMDEAWRFFQNPTTRQYIVEALKTWRKRNAALILATQSGEDLEQSEILPIVVEGCATKMFLANAGMDEEWYRRVFKLNITESETAARLIPKRQFLLKRPDYAKVLNLNVDPKGYWLYTNSPYDNQRKREAFARYGFEQGLEMLARSKP